MPFPPAFSNPWDNTIPPDTQAANQLGADLRAFRTDVQQRLSLLSGTLANRPTNMDATFGGAGYGIVFFSTDTQQIFQWNGAAWVDITSTLAPNVLDQQGPAAQLTGNGADQTIYTKNIGAGIIKAGAGLRITACWMRSVGLGAVTYKLTIGATVFETLPYSPFSNVFFDKFTWTIFNNAGAQNAQNWLRESVQNINGIGASIPALNAGVAAVDFTIAEQVTLSFNGANTEKLIPEFWLIENVHL
jgi:hypothetical protein